MKKLKKLMAVLTAAMTVISMSLPAMADGVKPTDADKQTATVSNVEAGATVTAYQIVKADYNDNGFIGYSAVEGVTLADVTKPTSTEVSKIAQDIISNTITPTPTKVGMTAGTTDDKGLAAFKADLAPGYWVVLVDGAVQEVYNPMLVGVYYSKSGTDNKMTSDPVDANTNWTLETENAYAKSTEPDIDKTIVDSGSGNDKGDDVAVGDTVKFQIKSAIPSYSEQYTDVIVRISDTLSDGLKLNQDTVKVEGLTKDIDYSVSTDDHSFVITIHSDYALAHGNQELIVTYDAELTDDAGINFDANTNTATLEYSNNPTDWENPKKKEDKTYHYTFGIDTKLNGTSEDTWNKVTKELIKGETVKETVDGETVENFVPLEGAEFTLTNNDITKSYVATSDKDGYLKFTGLDAGDYTLVETKAPEGYTLNNETIPVKITAEYNTDGTLKSYSITVDGKATSTYEGTYSKEGVTTTRVTEVTGDSSTTKINNTKLNDLPSTGGMGTYLFTIAGVAIISVAAIMLFVSKKKRV